MKPNYAILRFTGYTESDALKDYRYRELRVREVQYPLER